MNEANYIAMKKATVMLDLNFNEFDSDIRDYCCFVDLLLTGTRIITRKICRSWN